MLLSKHDLAMIDAIKKNYHFNKNDEIVSGVGNILNVQINNSGYPCFSIVDSENKSRKIRVHRFKAYILYGNKIFEPNVEVRHLNGNKMDWSNLNVVFGSHYENMMDVSKEKRSNRAKNAAKELRKFNEIEIKYILKMRKDGFAYQKIADKCGCAKSTIFYIVNHQTYLDIKFEKE